MVLEFPQASVAVKVTVAAPVAPHQSLNDVKSFVQVTSEHGSDALAPPWELSQLFNSVVLLEPSHSTVSSEA